MHFYIFYANLWEFDVNPFGTFKVRIGAIASVFVKPLDLQKFPLQNKAFVRVLEHMSICCHLIEAYIMY
jgi:hypothetical protein